MYEFITDNKKSTEKIKNNNINDIPKNNSK